MLHKIWRSKRRLLLLVNILAILGLLILLTLPPTFNKRPNTLKLPPNLETLTAENAQQLVSFGELNEGGLVAFHPNKPLIAVSPFQEHPQVINYLTGEIIGTFDYGRCFAFSPDGNTLAICANYSQTGISLWNVFSHQQLATFVGHTGDMNSLAFSPDGKWLASASMDNTIRIWDVAQKKLHSVLQGHTDWVNEVTFSPDGTYLASESRDGSIRIWDTATWQTITVLRVKDTRPWNLAYNPQGHGLAVGYIDHLIRLWSPQTGEIIGTLKGHSREVWGLAFAFDGRLLASTSLDTTLRLWDAVTLKSLREITFQPILGLGGVNFSPDGQLLLLGKNLSTIEFWGVPAAN